MPKDHSRRLLELARRRGFIRASDLGKFAIPRSYLARLTTQGKLEKIGRGLYAVVGAPITERYSLAVACKKVPAGVICLLSALQFHGLGTQMPFEVWMAISSKSYRPEFVDQPMRLVEFSTNLHRSGIEVYNYENSQIRVYSAAKTVADCFHFRHKIGLDVALEALRAYINNRDNTMDELWKYAKLCRVSTVIRPYVEALR